jgi:hypothetical protein
MHPCIKLWADIRGIDYSEITISDNGFIHNNEFHEIVMADIDVAILRCLFRDGVRIINKQPSKNVIGYRRRSKMKSAV